MRGSGRLALRLGLRAASRIVAVAGFSGMTWARFFSCVRRGWPPVIARERTGAWRPSARTTPRTWLHSSAGSSRSIGIKQ